MESLARKPQSINTTPATREKSERLDIVMMTSTYALIQGSKDIQQVWLDTLECSCKAAEFGLRCSHVMRVIREIARRADMPAVMFANSPKHAASWARLQESKGRTARVDEVAGYAVCVSGKPTPTVARPKRSQAEINSRAEELFA